MSTANQSFLSAQNLGNKSAVKNLRELYNIGCLCKKNNKTEK